MKYLILILSSILIFNGCRNSSNQELILEGDLYYTWLKLGSFYKQPDSLYQNYVRLKDSLGIKELKKLDSIGTSHIELLEQYDLVKSPYIYLRTDFDSVYVIYMNHEDYRPITEYSYKSLIDNNQKIRLTLVSERISDKLQICRKVISLKKIKGQTFQMQKKFRIEEYR